MRLTDIINDRGFVFTCEIPSPKGVSVDDFLQKADLIAGAVDAVVVGDNQRAVMRASSLALCRLLKARNIEPVMSLSTRDRNCLALQADLLGAAIMGIDNVVLLSGYEPAVGDHINAKVVRDIDTAELVGAAAGLVAGQDMTGHQLNGAPKFGFGVVAQPGLGVDEAHLSALKAQVAAGAQFIITHAIYDPVILKRFQDAISDIDVPVIVGHTMLKSASMASFMSSNLPGMNVPEAMIIELEGLPREKIAAKSVAISQKLLAELKPMCQGFLLMPEGWERHVPALVEAVR
jgi:methylenetetrahydrofolate reductase (NADH)